MKAGGHKDKPLDGAGHYMPLNGHVGILGGGQLGRLLAMAASRLGLNVHILCPEENCPAARVATSHIVADYTDERALTQLAQMCDVVTYEFENVPAQSVTTIIERGASVFPGAKPLAIAQDRLLEKRFVHEIGGQTPIFHPVDDLASLEEGLKKTGRPAILKTRHLGYDGKGQTRISPETDDLGATWQDAIEHAWNEIGAKPSILEAFVPFECEVSIIAARSQTGEIALYDPSENIHDHGILRTSTVPATITAKSEQVIRDLTHKIIAELDYVGVIGIEYFVAGDGEILVNEFAPRVHNSGHWTEAACTISQFEQHIRAVCGWPLGDPNRHSNGVMTNLLGSEMDDWRQFADEKNTMLTLYGKREGREGRKMGHYTRLASRS